MDCIFCDVVTGIAPCDKVYENDLIVVIMDIDPFTRGHMLVLPKHHYSSVLSVPDDVLSAMLVIAKKLINALKEVFNYPSCNFVMTDGEAMDVPHVHLHVFGRMKKDVLSWSENHGLDSENRKDVAKRLRLFLD